MSASESSFVMPEEEEERVVEDLSVTTTMSLTTAPAPVPTALPPVLVRFLCSPRFIVVVIIVDAAAIPGVAVVVIIAAAVVIAALPAIAAVVVAVPLPLPILFRCLEGNLGRTFRSSKTFLAKSLETRASLAKNPIDVPGPN